LKRIIVLQLLLLFLIVTPFILDVQAESVGGPYKDQCPAYPICLMNNVELNTKYGQITSLRNMAFNWFAVYANGTIYFDAYGMVPQREEVLVFNLQSYGNGSFDVRIGGPPVVAASCNCPIDSHLSTNLPSGLGAEFFFSGNMNSLKQLVITYTAFGGSCVPACIAGSPFWPTLLIIAAIILLVALGLSQREKKTVKKPEQFTSIGS
jgi:hypothetical protein